jgi:hypothetical protein
MIEDNLKQHTFEGADRGHGRGGPGQREAHRLGRADRDRPSGGSSRGLSQSRGGRGRARPRHQAPLPVGTFIASSMLSPSGALPDSAQALVGLDLKAGQVPAGGLVIGQKVLVVLLPVNSQGVPQTPIALISTRVWDLQPPTSSGEMQASVLVPTTVATTLAGYAARGEVSLVATAAPPAPTTTPKPRKPAKRKSHS